jgi:hypothetical protein
MSGHFFKHIINFRSFAYSILIALFLMGFVNIGLSQTINTPFGKNRVQYHDDFNNWWMYETDHFVSFWYGKGRNIAKSVIQLAEMDHNDIEHLLGHSMNDKIRIIIYLDHSDYTQTNIAYWDTKEAGGAGIAQFYDNKVIVYFDGNHQNLRKQIRAGITRAFLISMFKGITIQEIYNNLVSSELPKWFVSGLVSYISDPWPSEVEAELRSLFISEKKKVKKFNSFSGDFPELAGHSMWNYLAHKYGNQAVSDFLYLVRIHKDINRAFKYVYGVEGRFIYNEWFQFYDQHYGRYQEEQTKAPVFLLQMDFDYPVSRVCLDDKAEKLFYVENNFGRVKLKYRKLASGNEKVLLKYGYRNEHQLTDLHYPLIKYDSTEQKLAVIYEHKDKLYYRSISLTDLSYTEQLFPESIQRIYSFDFYEPGFLILAGSMDGFSDLHYYDIEKRQFERITDDYFDKSGLVKVSDQNRSGILLLSNTESERIEPALYDSFPPISDFDLHFYDPENQFGEKLTTDEQIDENNLLVDGKKILWLSDKNYFNMPYIWGFGQTDPKPFARGNMPSNVISHDLRNQHYVSARKSSYNKWTIEIQQMMDPLANGPENTDLRFKNPFHSDLEALKIDIGKKQLMDEIEIDVSLLFQTKFGDAEKKKEKDLLEQIQLSENSETVNSTIEVPLPIFNRSRAVAARLRFSFNELITKVDNEALFEGLETFNKYNDSYSPPPSGLLVKTAVKDLFEDHVIEGGVRIASDFRGAEYFLSYDNQKNKIDWKYALYRRSKSSYENVLGQGAEPDKLKLRTNLALVRAKYPFDIYTSLHFTGTIRFDNTILTASNLETLNILDFSNQRLMLGTAYIFDNTSNKSTNLLSGTRYKVFAGFSNRFNIQFTEQAAFQLSLGRMGVVGFDARHYFDLLKFSTLAIRFAGQSSFGNEKNLYFLGGMENWLFSRNSELYPIPQGQEFAFKVLAANVRGFEYNSRNGSSFGLMNLEVRVPVFSYLFRSHIKFAFFRDFQLTGFFDAGAAWYGISPYSEKNEANVYYHEAPPAVLLKIKQFNDPLVAGMGVGMRTSLFGYFIKVDYAWGIESGRILDPMIYFSLGYDF